MKKILISLSILSITVLCQLLLLLPVNAQVGGVIVYPNKIELDFSKSERKFISSVIYVQNPSNETLRVKTTTNDWVLDEIGTLKFIDTPEKDSLGPYIKFNPKEFDLAPGQKQVIRVTAKLPEGEDGEFRSMIFFESIRSKEDLIQPKTNKNSLSLTINVTTRYGVTVFAYKGDLTRTAELKNFYYQEGCSDTSEEGYLVANFSNAGNIHSLIEGELILRNIDNTEEGNVIVPIRRPIAPNSTHDIHFNLPIEKLADGKYSAKLYVNYKDMEEKPHLIEAETDFNFIKPDKPSAKSRLIKPTPDEEIEPTPENIAKPIEIDETEIKLSPEDKDLNIDETEIELKFPKNNNN